LHGQLCAEGYCVPGTGSSTIASVPTLNRGVVREDAIIEAARALNDLDIDLLKLEYPGSPEGCRRLSAVLGRPWAVLSAGVPFDQFTDIIRIAADEGGASGFIAGRSVWREVVGLVGQQREEFLTSVALPRLERLVAMAERRARPWREVTDQRPDPVLTTCTPRS
jgi:sulfofructosephosphate aldolase